MQVTARRAKQSVLHLSSRCRCGVNFRPRALYSRHLLNGRGVGVGPGASLGHFEGEKKPPAAAGNSDGKTMGEGGLTFSTNMLYVFDLSHPCYMSGSLHLLFSLKMPGDVSTFLSSSLCTFIQPVCTYIATSAA